MATLASLKKKLAALEAQVEQVTKTEMGSAIAKVRKIMADFGLTVEHLATDASAARAPRKSSATKSAAKSASKPKGSKPAKYRDPETGITWAGVGRAPSWIASAKNRDDFLIVKADSSSGSAKAGTPAKKAAKRAPSVKRAMAAAAEKAAGKAGTTAKRAAKAATEKVVAKPAATKKAVAKKGVAKKAGAKKVAAKAPVAKVARKRVAAKNTAEASSSVASPEVSAT